MKKEFFFLKFTEFIYLKGMLRSEKNTETDDLIIGRHQATTEVFSFSNFMIFH